MLGRSILRPVRSRRERFTLALVLGGEKTRRFVPQRDASSIPPASLSLSFSARILPPSGKDSQRRVSNYKARSEKLNTAIDRRNVISVCSLARSPEESLEEILHQRVRRLRFHRVYVFRSFILTKTNQTHNRNNYFRTA